MKVYSRLEGLISPSFFFQDAATTETYTLSLHDALPISERELLGELRVVLLHPLHPEGQPAAPAFQERDRKSTRLNSSHSQISYAVFCLKIKTLHRSKRAARQFDAVDVRFDPAGQQRVAA